MAEDNLGRRDYDSKVATLEEKVRQLEVRCDKKDIKIEALMEFHHRAIGYAMAASVVIAVIAQYMSAGKA